MNIEMEKQKGTAAMRKFRGVSNGGQELNAKNGLIRKC